MTQDCENYRELLAAHALTALDAAEAASLEAHLVSCADCRAELNAWEATTALLALDAEPVEPPAQLRESILASVREDREAGETREDRVSRTVAADRSAALDHGRESVSGAQGESKVLPFARPPKPIWASLGSIGAIAALLVFAVSLIVLLTLWRQNRALQEELAHATREMKQAEAKLEHQRSIVAMLTAPGAQMAKLSGTNMAPGARAMLAFDKSGHAMLMTNGLPAAPEGMAYQLWFIKDDKKMPGKVFTPDAAGNGMLEDQVPDSAREAAVFAVTLEPKSGVPAPTGSIYLLSSG
jgi:anti-sigma-K factor RskA